MYLVQTCQTACGHSFIKIVSIMGTQKTPSKVEQAYKSVNNTHFKLSLSSAVKQVCKQIIELTTYSQSCWSLDQIQHWYTKRKFQHTESIDVLWSARLFTLLCCIVNSHIQYSRSNTQHHFFGLMVQSPWFSRG